MNQITQLTVAKICHEMANHLSIIKFLQEDLAEHNSPELKELLRTVDLLSLTMDFFRNIYSAKIDSVSLFETLKKIYNLKGISLSDPYTIVQSLPENLQNAISGILYTIMKVSKPGDIVKVSGNFSMIVVDVPKDRALPKNVSASLEETSVNDDIFNIFVNYTKYLADLEDYKILQERFGEEQRIKFIRATKS